MKSTTETIQLQALPLEAPSRLVLVPDIIEKLGVLETEIIVAVEVAGKRVGVVTNKKVVVIAGIGIKKTGIVIVGAETINGEVIEVIEVIGVIEEGEGKIVEEEAEE